MKLASKWAFSLLMVAVVGVLAGCAHPYRDTPDLRLGMTNDEVRDVMGDPTAIRASKVYEDGQTTEVWEYLSGIALNPKNYWVHFENGKVVQWGEPGDFAGKAGDRVPVEEYKAVKQAR